MARFRNVSPEARTVAYGLPGARTVAPDEVFDVDDEVADSYASQEALWAAVSDAPASSRKAAATPAATEEA